MKYFGNVIDPSKGRETIVVHMRSETNTTFSDTQLWATYRAQVKGKTIGEPQATTTFTASELKQQGYVGLYT